MSTVGVKLGWLGDDVTVSPDYDELEPSNNGKPVRVEGPWVDGGQPTMTWVDDITTQVCQGAP